MDKHFNKFASSLFAYRVTVKQYHDAREEIWNRVQQVINSIGCAFGDPELRLNFWWGEPEDGGIGHVDPDDLIYDSSFWVDCRPSDCNHETYVFLQGGIPSMYLYMDDKAIIKDVQKRAEAAKQQAKAKKQTAATLLESARSKLTPEEWNALGIAKGSS